MTKVRPPLSFAQAVTRIGGRLGWERAAAAVGKSERTVRSWSDPDTGALPSIEEALALDAAYRNDGAGEGPLLAVYATRLGLELRAPADSEALAAAAAEAAREAGAAVAALVTASQPGADRKVRARAEQESEDAIGAFREVIAQLEGEAP